MHNIEGESTTKEWVRRPYEISIKFTRYRCEYHHEIPRDIEYYRKNVEKRRVDFARVPIHARSLRFNVTTIGVLDHLPSQHGRHEGAQVGVQGLNDTPESNGTLRSYNFPLILRRHHVSPEIGAVAHPPIHTRAHAHARAHTHIVVSCRRRPPRRPRFGKSARVLIVPLAFMLIKLHSRRWIRCR